jgi:hypothetical protein
MWIGNNRETGGPSGPSGPTGPSGTRRLSNYKLHDNYKSLSCGVSSRAPATIAERQSI